MMIFPSRATVAGSIFAITCVSVFNTGAKFAGRALMYWGRERELDTLFRNAGIFAAEMPKADPDIVF